MSFLLSDPFERYSWRGPQRQARTPRPMFYPQAYAYDDNENDTASSLAGDRYPFGAFFGHPGYMGAYGSRGRKPRPHMASAQYEQRTHEAARKEEVQEDAMCRRRPQQQQQQQQQQEKQEKQLEEARKVSTSHTCTHRQSPQHIRAPTSAATRRTAAKQQQVRERMRHTNAARTIQRWVRSVVLPMIAQRQLAATAQQQAEAEAARMEQAALTITRALRAVTERKRAQQVVTNMRKLSDLVRDADRLREEFYDRVFTKPVHDARGRVSFALLGYVDMLEKLVLRTDDIPTHGSAAVRERRKATVRHIQRLLEEADRYRNNGPQHGVDMEETVPEHSPMDVDKEDEWESDSDGTAYDCK